MSNDTTDRLQYLLDRDAINQLLCSYCDALDFRRWELLDNVFASDVISHFPTEDTEGSDPFLVLHSRVDTVEFIRSAFTHLGPTHHQLGNFSVTIDGDAADVAVRVRAYHENKCDPSLFEESLATFTGTVKRTATGWLIVEFTERILIMLGGADAFAPTEATSGGHSIGTGAPTPM